MKRGTARPRGRYRAGAGDKGVGKICKERARTPGGVDFSARDFDFGGTRGGGVEQHLFERYPRFMRVTTVEGVEVNVDEVEVLRCAGQIFERRRRTRSGPIRRHPCRGVRRLSADARRGPNMNSVARSGAIADLWNPAISSGWISPPTQSAMVPEPPWRTGGAS